MSAAQLEDTLGLGPGWVDLFESGDGVPSLDGVLALAGALGVEPVKLFEGIGFSDVETSSFRQLRYEQTPEGTWIHFRYAKHDARYLLRGASAADVRSVVLLLRDGLARLATQDARDVESIKTDAVARAFLEAVRLWPMTNPSDLWWFLIYRSYCDPYNHPAAYSRLDFGQSWKRTGGWALEQVLVRHYAPHFAANGIRLFIATTEEKNRFLSQLVVADRLEADKADVLLTGLVGAEERCFGVVHVKASFAERRTDDIPMSRALVEAGYVSPLWTFDCKSTPHDLPRNRGELGKARGAASDKRSAKRKDIEDDGFFSACFSYNSNTVPTPSSQPATARIMLCNFTDPDDNFTRFIIERWRQFA